MHAVQANIYEVEIVPHLLGKQVADHLPLLAAHLEDLLFEPILVIGSETGHVDGVFTHERGDLFLDLRRMREFIRRCIRREKAADAYAIYVSRREPGRHAAPKRDLSPLPRTIPDPRRLNREGTPDP